MRKRKAGAVEAAETLLYLLRSPLARVVFGLANVRCPKHGQKFIEYALDDYIGKKRSTCVTCDWFAKMISLALKKGEAAFGVKQDWLEKIISDIHYRRGLIAVLEGIGQLGVTRPFTPISPFLVARAERLRGRCRHCNFRHVCGGCRAGAYAYHGDYLAPDPGCIRELEEPSVSFVEVPKMKLAPFPATPKREVLIEV